MRAQRAQWAQRLAVSVVHDRQPSPTNTKAAAMARYRTPLPLFGAPQPQSTQSSSAASNGPPSSSGNSASTSLDAAGAAVASASTALDRVMGLMDGFEVSLSLSLWALRSENKARTGLERARWRPGRVLRAHTPVSWSQSLALPRSEGFNRRAICHETVSLCSLSGFFGAVIGPLWPSSGCALSPAVELCTEHCSAMACPNRSQDAVD